MQSLAAIFQRRVRDEDLAPAVTVAGSESCEETVGKMAKAKASAALVTDKEGRPQGIVTEADVVRRIMPGGHGKAPTEKHMSKPVQVADADEFLYNAIGRMRRLELRHLPVVDADGRTIGVLNLDAAYAASLPRVTGLIDRLTHDASLEGLGAVKAAQVELAEALFEEQLQAPEIQAVLSGINTDIHARVADLLVEEMRAEKAWGAPPVAFALIVMGSAGRGESLLRPDQDNGFILDDYPDKDHNRIDAWFRELAERMTRALDSLGFPFCDGYVMATNPLWRKTRSQWRAQLDIWSAQRLGNSARFADILADFDGVWGAQDFADELRRAFRERMAGAPGFLRDMYQLQAEHRVPIGWFGRLITESRKPEHRGEINLKHWGTLPLVEGARILALQHGIDATSTRTRLAELRARDAIDADEYDYVVSAFGNLTHLLLRRQLDDFRAGRPIANFVDPKALTRREIDQMKDGLRAIGRFRDTVRTAFMGGVVG